MNCDTRPGGDSDMSNGFKWGLLILGFLLSMWRGLLASTAAPILMGIGLYELLAIKKSNFLAVLVPTVLVLVYVYVIELLAGGVPKLF